MKLTAKQQAFRIALSYGVAAGCWIFLSDELTTRWFDDSSTRGCVSLAKGWGFVLVTTGLLFFLLRRLLRRWEKEVEHRQNMESSLLRGERAQRIVSECTQAIVRAAAEPALLEEICRVIVQAGGYRMAWVGFPENDTTKSIRFAAHAGDTEGYLAEAKISWDETSERGRGPTGITLRTGQITINRDFQNDPNLGPWREAAARCGYAASIRLPLRHQGKTFGVLSLYAGEVNAFNPTEVELLTELADDLAHGIQALRNQLAREQAEAAVCESDLLLRSIMEHSNEIIFVKDRECRFVYMNPAGYRFSGMTPEKLLGRSKADFHPNPVEAERFMVDDRRVMDSGATEVLEEAIRSADGVSHTFLTTKVPRRDSAGQVIGLIGVAHDITQRKQSEMQLRASEAKFSAMFHSSPVSMTLSRLDNGHYLDVNEAYLKVLERSREEVLGHSALDLGVWANAEQRALVVARLHAEGTVRDFVLEIRGKSGEVRHLLWSAEKVVIGDIECMLSSGQDITEHRFAEQNLRESQALYHSLVSQLPIGVFRKDRAGRFVVVNPAFCQLKGMSPEHFLGKTPLEAAQAGSGPGTLVRQTGKYATAGEDHHRRIMQTGEAIELVEEYALPDGGRQFVHVMKFPVLDAAGHIVGSQGVQFDITARKRAEDQLSLQSSALTAAANAIVITDAHGRIEWVNPAFTDLTGYEAAAVLGQKLSMLKSQHHPAAFYAAMWNTILAGNVWQGEVVNQRKDGSLYTEEMTITPVRGAGGKIAHFVAIKQDISERRQLENRLQQAQKMEAIGTLAGGIAHDFNNILAAILGFSYLLQQDTEDNPPAQEEIREIIKASCRAKDLVQQILTFSRKREQERQVIQLNTVVKEAARFLRASLPTQIEIETHLDEAAPAVLADPTQIYQMAVNLGTNALHAMEGRPGKLTGPVPMPNSL